MIDLESWAEKTLMKSGKGETVQIENQKKCCNIIFDSLAEQMDEVMKLQPELATPIEPHKSRWFGRTLNGWGSVKTAMESEWEEGMRHHRNMMNQLRDEHIPQPRSLRRRSRWSEEDGEVDVDRAFSNPDYMRDTYREHRPGPLSYTIICNMSYHAGTDALDILWGASASVCLMELLEASGYRVELWGALVGGSVWGWTDGLIAGCYKRGGDPIDASTLINALSGWSLRTLYFGLMFVKGQPNSGYGSPMRISPEHQAQITPDIQVTICEKIESFSQAVKWVREKLAELK